MKIKLLKKELIFSYINIAILIFNIFLTIFNLYLVKQSNKISSNSLGFAVDSRSQDYVTKAYDQLYLNQHNLDMINQLKQQDLIKDEAKLLKIVDVLEEIGSNFCQGTVKARHIRIYLQNTIALTCNSDEILKYFNGKKNGNAILCSEFFPESKFAKTLQSKYINTCEFVDSARFPKTINKLKFEY
ncbi:MAG: hypothetical protein AAB966_04855 [Patescibacteria group bacterium]